MALQDCNIGIKKGMHDRKDRKWRSKKWVGVETRSVPRKTHHIFIYKVAEIATDTDAHKILISSLYKVNDDDMLWKKPNPRI